MIPKNRKGTIAMYGTAIGLLLVFCVFLYYSGQTDKYTVNFGMNQSRILKTYQEGERMLFFADQAARLAMQQAAYDLGKRGFYSADRYADAGNAALWKHDTVEVRGELLEVKRKTHTNIPTQGEVKYYFSRLSSDSFDRQIRAYNENKKEEEAGMLSSGEYASLDAESGGSRTWLTGTASSSVEIKNEAVTYAFRPSFRQAISIDVLSDLSKLASYVKATDFTGHDKESITAGITEKGLDSEVTKYSKQNDRTVFLKTIYNACCSEYSCEDSEGNPETCCNGGYEDIYQVYDEVNADISVHTNKQFYVYDGEVELKPINYDFAISWIELKSMCSKGCDNADCP